jgi:hypothetical protein
MLRMTRSLSVLILAGAMAPVVGNAAPFGNFLHLHPVSDSKNGRISFTLVNKSNVAKDVTVDGHTYTLAPKQPVTVSALPGSKVIEGGSGSANAEKVLFTVDRMHKGATVNLN